MNKIKSIKGTYDILPGDVETWQFVEDTVRKWMRIYACFEIRTPIFEQTSLFARSIGEDTDIVGKEMYTFTDMGSRSLTLRPEGTASVIRSFIEHSLDQRGLPQNLWYMGPMFRQERPQKGRQRQFHQFGVEMVGSASPMTDVQAMALFDSIAGDLGLDERMYSINSLGGDDSREAYRSALVAFLDSVEDRLCEDCKRRKGTNPLRVLDCKNPGCNEAVHDSENLPKSVDSLTEDDRSYYDAVKKLLEESGIAFEEDPFLVRGLDYYTGVVFEMKYTGLGAQSAIMGGGRYNKLIKQLGGPDLPAVGFACGMERLVMVMQANDNVKSQAVDVYVVNSGTDVDTKALRYVMKLRKQGNSAATDHLGRSVKAQMRTASKLNVRYVLFPEEGEGQVGIRNMERSDQETLPFEEFLTIVKNN